jgi:hypothetical protein
MEEHEGIGPFSSRTGFLSDLQNLYTNLGAVVHRRGKVNLSMNLEASSSNVNGYDLRSFHKEPLEKFFRLLYEVLSKVGCLYALYNPVILKGLPLFEKFGDNSPAFGFLNQYQSELLWKTIETKYHADLRKFAEESTEAVSLKEWVHSHPDMTEQDYINQEIAWDELFKGLIDK